MDGSCGRHARVLWLRRVSTGRLNRFLAKLGARISGGGGTAKEVARLKYLTQVCQHVWAKRRRACVQMCILHGVRSVAGVLGAGLPISHMQAGPCAYCAILLRAGFASALCFMVFAHGKDCLWVSMCLFCAHKHQHTCIHACILYAFTDTLRLQLMLVS